MAFTNILNKSDRARVGGSSFTVFTWRDEAILFARQISHRSPTPVGPGTTPIHPMDTPYPVELITPMASTMGEIVMEFYELFGSNVWEHLAGLGRDSGNGPVDLVGIFQAVANLSTPVHIIKYIKPPAGFTGSGGSTITPYTEEYHNCVISQVNDGETIEVGTMEVLKQIVVNYTHITRGGENNVLDTVASLGTKTNPARNSNASLGETYR